MRKAIAAFAFLILTIPAHAYNATQVAAAYVLKTGGQSVPRQVIVVNNDQFDYAQKRSEYVARINEYR
jgi:hypothetical protein